jgi:RHS repeat-associated protein
VTEVDPRGNVQGANPADYTTTTAYDAVGRPTSITDPLGHTTSYSYNPTSNISSITDANGHSTSYTYDSLDRLASVVAPDGGTTSYTYDGNGNVLTRTDANNHTTSFAYDLDNRVTSRTSPTGQRWSYEYDGAGNLSSMTDANGNATQANGDGTTSYTYDADGRVKTITYSDAGSVMYDYDAVGNRTSMSDAAGTASYSYDSADRLTSQSRGTDTFTYVYDSAGNLTSRTYPDGTVTAYTYDEDGRLKTATSGGNVTTYGYDAAGNLASTSLPGTTGEVETRTYDRAGRLAEVKTANEANTLTDFAYVRDAVGDPTQVTRSGDIAETATYTYDSSNRLTSVCFQVSCPNGSDPFIRWTYDAVGNRLTETRPSGTTTYTYDAADELTAAGAVTYAYDANGQETRAGSRTYSYNDAGRLIATTLGASTTTYSYDGDGNRIDSSSGSMTTHYLWDQNNALPEVAIERDPSGALIRRYIYGIARIAMTNPGGSYYFAYDGSGSVADLISSSGAPQWTYDYEPFGSLRTETQTDPSAPVNVIKFDGQMVDASGLYNLRARQYDPTTGRFLSLDPRQVGTSKPAEASYVYAENDPVALDDPTGLGAVWAANDGQTKAYDAASPARQPTCPERTGHPQETALGHQSAQLYSYLELVRRYGLRWCIYEEYPVPGGGEKGGYTQVDLGMTDPGETQGWFWEITTPGRQPNRYKKLLTKLAALDKRLSASAGFSVWGPVPVDVNAYMVSDGSFPGIIAWWEQGKKAPKPNPKPVPAPKPDPGRAPQPTTPPFIPPILPVPVSGTPPVAGPGRVPA